MPMHHAYSRLRRGTAVHAEAKSQRVRLRMLPVSPFSFTLPIFLSGSRMLSPFFVPSASSHGSLIENQNSGELIGGGGGIRRDRGCSRHVY